MAIKTICIGILMVFLLTQKENCGTTSDNMKISLTTNQNEQGLFCIIHFQNDSPHPFYLNKIDVGLAGRIKSKIFIVKKGEEVVPYSGIMMKRRIATADDFVLLEPKESLRTSIQIDKAYKFSKGLNQYTIQYSYYHSSPEENPQLNKLESDIVSFEYNKP